jgi:hypothetical protein
MALAMEKTDVLKDYYLDTPVLRYPVQVRWQHSFLKLIKQDEKRTFEANNSLLLGPVDGLQSPLTFMVEGGKL